MTDVLDCAELLEFHGRLLAGDPFARESFMCRFLPHLFDTTKRRFAENDADFVHDATVDAVLEFCKRPKTFDPRRETSLKAFLLSAAWCNARNRIASERRLKERERRVAEKKPEICVALDPSARDISIEEQDRLAADVEEILTPLKVRDREFFARYLEGVRQTTVFAQILQIEHLPVEEQRLEVKRNKDRIRAILKRKGLLRRRGKKNPRAVRPKSESLSTCSPDGSLDRPSQNNSRTPYDE